MLLSRFWYIVLSLVLGALVFVLFVAQSVHNRMVARNAAEGLQADAQVVSWYLKNDARERSAQLIKFALDDDIAKNLSTSSNSDSGVPSKARNTVQTQLKKVAQSLPKDVQFDAVFAVDQHGRVVAHLGYEQASGIEDFELGGYPVVADALHGYIRDDTLVLDRVYRIVTRPVEYEIGQLPAGAIVGARIIDDRFARELSQRTGAAVAFYTDGQRVASGAPEGFERSQLDMIVNDLDEVSADEEYKTKGRSAVRTLAKSVAVVYSRLPGEAWDLGAGYVVGRSTSGVDTPLAFFSVADDKDKSNASILIVALVIILGTAVGIGLTLLEHTRPLVIFRGEARRLAKGESDQLTPSQFRGVYRTIASDINDGIDTAVGKAGGTRRAADLQQVLGELPAEPQMSAFSFPGDGAQQPAPPRAPMPRKPTPGEMPAVQLGSLGDFGGVSRSDVTTASSVEPGDDADWPRVYDEFVALKQQCGEKLDGFTFEKFRLTLRKNRDAIKQRHGVQKVKFTVYVKGEKAALKASPIRD